MQFYGFENGGLLGFTGTWVAFPSPPFNDHNISDLEQLYCVKSCFRACMSDASVLLLLETRLLCKSKERNKM